MTTRQFLGLAAAALWLTGCQSNDYHIEGVADSLTDEEIVYLSVNLETRMPVDSTVVSQGQFQFDGTTDSTQAAVIYAKHSPSQTIEFLLTPGSADIVLSPTPGHSRISGSRLHDEWQNMNDQLNEYADQLRSLVKASDHLTDSGQAALHAEAQRIEREMRACIVATAKRNASNPLGRFIATHFEDSLSYYK